MHTDIARAMYKAFLPDNIGSGISVSELLICAGKPTLDTLNTELLSWGYSLDGCFFGSSSWTSASTILYIQCVNNITLSIQMRTWAIV